MLRIITVWPMIHFIFRRLWIWSWKCPIAWTSEWQNSSVWSRYKDLQWDRETEENKTFTFNECCWYKWFQLFLILNMSMDIVSTLYISYMQTFYILQIILKCKDFYVEILNKYCFKDCKERFQFYHQTKITLNSYRQGTWG